MRGSVQSKNSASSGSTVLIQYLFAQTDVIQILGMDQPLVEYCAFMMYTLGLIAVCLLVLVLLWLPDMLRD